MDAEWIMRIFGSVEAWKRSLPNREWHSLGNGKWFSSERGQASDLALAGVFAMDERKGVA